MISATHTHAGLGGFSWHAFYNMSILGFIPQNFNAIVEGIVHSIGLAHGNIVPGWLRWSEQQAQDCGFNRAPTAYTRNEDAPCYDSDVDATMSVLQVMSGSTLLGVVAWHGVHCTCLDRDNTLVSGDSKGVAAYMFEKSMGVDYEAADHFVAAFPQGACGDVTPICSPCGDRGDGRILSIRNGWSQFRAAKAACEHGEVLHGDVACRHAYVDFNGLFVDSRKVALPSAAIGHAMAEGARDGKTPSSDLATVKRFTQLVRALGAQELTDELVAAHHPKKILWSMGDGKTSPSTWTPHILPLQLISIGSLCIIGVPFELSTMVSRRIRSALQKVLGGRVVCAGLTNAYAGYCTTFEEYQVQQYEGGHTMFGPHQQEALQQELIRLANLQPGYAGSLQPPDLGTVMQVNLQTGVFLDAPIIGYRFGDCIRDVPNNVRPGMLIEVEFCAGHPKNDLQTQRTYLAIERRESHGWCAIANDGDLETEFEWRRVGLAASKVIIRWHVPLLAKGMHRIRHFGAYRGLSRAIVPYTGCSREFDVSPQPNDASGAALGTGAFALASLADCRVWARL
jgi:neutral ceramidase